MTYYLDLDSFGSYSGWFIDVYRCLWFDVVQHPENLLHGHSYSTDLQRCWKTWSPALGRLFFPSTTLQPPDLIRFAIQHPNKTSQVVRMTNWYKIKLGRRIAAGHVEYLKGTDAERSWYPNISHVKSIGKHLESLTCRVPTLRPLFVKTDRSSPGAILSWLAVIVADLGASESGVHLSQISSCKQIMHRYLCQLANVC